MMELELLASYSVRSSVYFARENVLTARLIHDLAADGFPVAVLCRVLQVPRSSYYSAIADRPPAGRQIEGTNLTSEIRAVHAMSRGTYGVRRVRVEFVLGRPIRCGHYRVACLVREAGLQGVHHRRWRSGRSPAVFADHVNRRFAACAPDRLWVIDITHRRSAEGWVCCTAVIDVCSRCYLGLSMADHLGTELVVDAVEMARWQCTPAGTAE